ncbi:hypothetical protein TNCV_1082351 [Trichonephila clavipes]|nr:hypothetical protein TNCV_1082351 [Trichonephila clavipes]
MFFHALLQNILKILNSIYVGASRWSISDRKVSGICLQPASSQPTLVRGTVVFLENSITVRITEQYKRTEMVSQQPYVPNCIEGDWYTHQRSQTLP